MEHNEKTPLEPINASSTKFGAKYENQFVLLNDGKHVIGVDPSDPKCLILENMENGKADKLLEIESLEYFITTLLLDEDTGFLYCGDYNGRLYKFKFNNESKSCERVEDFGDIGIGEISCSRRFMNFVFFGGFEAKIKVLDLSTGELLPGQLETSIEWIYSLQVCVKNQDNIYLAVSGTSYNYSGDKTDLFDLADFLSKDLIILDEYVK